MLDTMNVATMDQWKTMPLSSSIIQLMNNLAVSRGAKPLQQELEFKLIHGRPVDDLTPEEARELFMDPAARKERMIVPSSKADLVDEQHSRSVNDDPASAEEDEQLVERDTSHQETHSDYGDEPDETHSDDGDEPDATLFGESRSQGAPARYDLRTERCYGHRDGPWRRDESIFERGFRISVKAGSKDLGMELLKRFSKNCNQFWQKEFSS